MSLVAFKLSYLHKLTHSVHKIILSCRLIKWCLLNYFLVIDDVIHKTSLLIPGDRKIPWDDVMYTN